MNDSLKFKDGFPLNEDGSEKTAEELLEFISKRPTLVSPLKIEDVAIFHDELLEEWTKDNGYVRLEEFAQKRNFNLAELLPIDK